jgi:hypothetical protein
LKLTFEILVWCFPTKDDSIGRDTQKDIPQKQVALVRGVKLHGRAS